MNDIEKLTDRDCAVLVGRPMELYYSEERDDFALTHNDPTSWVPGRVVYWRGRGRDRIG